MKNMMMTFALLFSSVTAFAGSSDCAALFGKYFYNNDGTLIHFEIQAAGPDSVALIRDGIADVKIVDGQSHKSDNSSYSATCSQTEGLVIVLDEDLAITTTFQPSAEGFRFITSVSGAEATIDFTREVSSAPAK